MRVTKHGRKRVLERTTLLEKDLVRIVENKAGVSLGTKEGVDFMLFWSPNERKYKIALVSLAGSLVSVWDSNFALPVEIRNPTMDDRANAKRELARMVLRNSVVAAERFPRIIRVRATRIVDVEMEVIRGGRIVFTGCIGKSDFSLVQTLDMLIAAMAPILKRVVESLESHPEHEPEALLFRFRRTYPGRVRKASDSIRYNTLCTKLKELT